MPSPGSHGPAIPHRPERTRSEATVCPQSPRRSIKQGDHHRDGRRRRNHQPACWTSVRAHAQPPVSRWTGTDTSALHARNIANGTFALEVANAKPFTSPARYLHRSATAWLNPAQRASDHDADLELGSLGPTMVDDHVRRAATTRAVSIDAAGAN